MTTVWPTGYSGIDPTSPTKWKEIWGDGIKVGAEQWDDGNTINNDGCQSDCTLITPGFAWASSSGSGDICTQWLTGYIVNSDKTSWVPIWGDSIRVSKEYWDDGNLINGDGCSSSWSIESGYSCTGGSTTSKDIWVKWSAGFYQDTSNPSSWISHWGDGLRAGSEAWDDGNTSSRDGCKGDCTSIESGCVWSGGSTTKKDYWTKCDKGYYQNNSQNPTSWISKCGDGIRVIYEAWDDGNTESGDGWSSDWTLIEDEYSWFGGNIGITDVWIKWEIGNNPKYDFSKWIGAEVPRNAQTIAAASQVAAALGVSSNLVVTMFSSSTSTSSNSFGMLNQIQLVIILPLIGAYVPEKIYDYLKSMSSSLFNFDFLPTSDSESVISIKELFDFNQPNFYLYLLKLDSGSALVNILNLTTTVGFVI